VVSVNPNDIEATQKSVKQEIERPEPSVIIAKSPCVLLPEMKKRKDRKLYLIIPEKCTGCRTCLKLGCPAIEWVPLTLRRQKTWLQGEPEGIFKDKRGVMRRLRSVCPSLQV